MLGLCYLFGEGVAKDKTEAVKWFQCAAEQGDPEAIYYLSKCYHDGIGILKDEDLAVEYLQKAAELGCANAQFELGLCCYNGMDVDKDPTAGIKLFGMAAKQGHDRAHATLEELAELGNKDAQIALKILFESIDKLKSLSADMFDDLDTEI